jgi:hypothetical protein
VLNSQKNAFVGVLYEVVLLEKESLNLMMVKQVSLLPLRLLQNLMMVLIAPTTTLVLTIWKTTKMIAAAADDAFDIDSDVDVVVEDDDHCRAVFLYVVSTMVLFGRTLSSEHIIAVR